MSMQISRCDKSDPDWYEKYSDADNWKRKIVKDDKGNVVFDGLVPKANSGITILDCLPDPVFWEERIDEETGEVLKDADGNVCLVSCGRTVESFKDETDVNKIIAKHQIKHAASHALRYPAEAYADFEGYDLLEAHRRLERAKAIFADAPSEVRREFGNDALKFAAFASDPANVNRLPELLPALAEPGGYFENPVHRGRAGAAAATPPPAGVDPSPGATPVEDPGPSEDG